MDKCVEVTDHAKMEYVTVMDSQGMHVRQNVLWMTAVSAMEQTHVMDATE